MGFFEKAARAVVNILATETMKPSGLEEQLAAVERLISRVKDWRYGHPELCKIPDAMPGECP